MGYLRVLTDPRASEQEAASAAQGLMDFQWKRVDRQRFRGSASADYVALREQTIEKLWESLLIGLPKMAERGNLMETWFAYRMITRQRYGAIRPRPEVLAKLRTLAPQAARALWRISVTNDPKGLYKSTALLKVRRQARSALCRSIGVAITKQLIRAQGEEFTKLLLQTIADSRPTFTLEQAVVLAAWGDKKQGVEFLRSGIKAGILRIRETRRS